MTCTVCIPRCVSYRFMSMLSHADRGRKLCIRSLLPTCMHGPPWSDVAPQVAPVWHVLNNMRLSFHSHEIWPLSRW